MFVFLALQKGVAPSASAKEDKGRQTKAPQVRTRTRTHPEKHFDRITGHASLLVCVQHYTRHIAGPLCSCCLRKRTAVYRLDGASGTKHTLRGVGIRRSPLRVDLLSHSSHLPRKQTRRRRFARPTFPALLAFVCNATCAETRSTTRSGSGRGGGGKGKSVCFHVVCALLPRAR